MRRILTTTCVMWLQAVHTSSRTLGVCWELLRGAARYVHRVVAVGKCMESVCCRCRPHSYSLRLHASSCCAQSTKEMPAVALLRQHLEACVQRAFNNCCLLR